MQQNKPFILKSNYNPAGDQNQAIDELYQGVLAKEQNQILLGVTGSGKTFTMANIIAKTQKPSLILAHNKTLAAQLYGEMKEFFPNNAVEYFVSYYDYYQPEAYVARTDTFIEKDASINDQIDLLRHSTTRSLFAEKNVIVVASVSCIYGIGSPESYQKMTLEVKKSDKIKFKDFIQNLVTLQYERSDHEFVRGKFRVRGDIIDLFPAHAENSAWRFNFFGDEIEEIYLIDALTGKKLEKLAECKIFANSHYITPEEILHNAIPAIKSELKERVDYFNKKGLIVESKRIEQRTNFDLEMIAETGSCKGIENYSRFLSGRKAGAPPPTLFEYFPKDSLLFIDESHVTTPQIHGMYNGDRSRKSNLVEHGFRLPSALDNRPLKYEEWDEMRPQTIFVSATPGKIEMGLTKGKYTSQIIRPTGLVDPICIVKPATEQVDDLIEECRNIIKRKLRVLVTTLTKKMAENLSDYLSEIGIRVKYLHSDIKTLERVEIIQDLRTGEFEVLVGVNLLREGLDIPECGLVAILDADKEGFLRSETSLIQTIGRAARNAEGKVILYADKMTNSLTKALAETERRRKLQLAYNEKHGISPKTINKNIGNLLETLVGARNSNKSDKKYDAEKLEKTIKNMREEMLEYAANLEFEKASELRDEIKKLEKIIMLS